jgi:5-methylcytosine-specific restriction endonuclease McrA
MGVPRYLPNHSPPPVLGFGPEHPSWIKDRSQRKGGQKGKEFNSWIRREIRKRCDNRCVCCGSTQNIEFDHIIPISSGGTGCPENGQLLCKKCHREKTNAEYALVTLIRRLNKFAQETRNVTERLRRWRCHYDRGRKSKELF